ncbi:MAG: dihydropteroate synthase [Lachnospiraceae bacterium]|nr:dihydropteroate synthase [Lachnospiraceae bacterium]
MKIGNRIFDENKTYIMGILNVTPDSFYDGGRFVKREAFIRQAETMAEQGADIIDIGGESTRPGYTETGEAEELSRVLPAVEEIRKRLDIPISVDTVKPKVAEEALKAGASMINDTSSLKDPGLSAVIAESGVPVCLMHNRREPVTDEGTAYLKGFTGELQDLLMRAQDAGIRREQIILDPGIGFAKTQEQNLTLLANPDILSAFSLPLLLGASRKSVIDHVLRLPVEERLEGTLAVSALAALSGYMFVRVHDVKENRRVIDMIAGIRAFKV